MEDVNTFVKTQLVPTPAHVTMDLSCMRTSMDVKKGAVLITLIPILETFLVQTGLTHILRRKTVPGYSQLLLAIESNLLLLILIWNHIKSVLMITFNYMMVHLSSQRL